MTRYRFVDTTFWKRHEDATKYGLTSNMSQLAVRCPLLWTRELNKQKTSRLVIVKRFLSVKGNGGCPQSHPTTRNNIHATTCETSTRRSRTRLVSWDTEDSCKADQRDFTERGGHVAPLNVERSSFAGRLPSLTVAGIMRATCFSGEGRLLMPEVWPSRNIYVILNFYNVHM